MQCSGSILPPFPSCETPRSHWTARAPSPTREEDDADIRQRLPGNQAIACCRCIEAKGLAVPATLAQSFESGRRSTDGACRGIRCATDGTRRAERGSALIELKDEPARSHRSALSCVLHSQACPSHSTRAPKQICPRPLRVRRVTFVLREGATHTVEFDRGPFHEGKFKVAPFPTSAFASRA